MLAVADQAEFTEPKGNRAVQIGLGVLGALLVLWLAWYLYSAFTGVHSVTVKNDQPVISPLLPPPPPPPPPPKEEIKPPEPTEKPTPTPTPSPEPKAAAPAPMQMNAEGAGGRDRRACRRVWRWHRLAWRHGYLRRHQLRHNERRHQRRILRANIKNAIQQRIQRDSKLSRMVFAADFAIWVSPSGAVTRAQLVSSSGDAKRDDMLKGIIEAVTGLDAPPASFKFPPPDHRQRQTVALAQIRYSTGRNDSHGSAT
jgi:protein TonB